MIPQHLIDALVLAVRNPGRCPEYHNKKLAQLRREWPVLYVAVMNIIKESEKDQ